MDQKREINKPLFPLQLEIIHKWASEMVAFKSLSCNDQKALLTSSAPEILVFSICCFSVQNKCGTLCDVTCCRVTSHVVV